jgi:hypothetical protein
MIENERSTAINPSEAVEEKVSLSDRFGLWLGFHKCSQDEYLDMIDGYVRYHGLNDRSEEQLRAEALEWATTRGSRSGRVAWQFIQDLAGRLGQRLDEMGRSLVGARTGGTLARRLFLAIRDIFADRQASEFSRTSKCSFGVSALPVMPERAISWPRRPCRRD